MFGAGLIRRRLQGTEQEIQSATAVGADLWQLGWRFRQLLLFWRDGAGIILRRCNRGRRDHEGRKEHRPEVRNAGESGCHPTSLDAADRSCKAASRMEL